MKQKPRLVRGFFLTMYPREQVHRQAAQSYSLKPLLYVVCIQQ